MTIYVVGYDLHPKQGETYDNLIKELNSFGANAWHCLDSTWLISTPLTAAQLRDRVWQHMRNDDQLLVVAYAPSNSAWIGFAGTCGDWLKAHM